MIIKEEWSGTKGDELCEIFVLVYVLTLKGGGVGW